MGRSTAPPPGRSVLKDVLLGACIAAVGAALVWRYYPGFWKEPDPGEQFALQQRQLLQQQARMAPPAPVPVKHAQAPAFPCEQDPLIAPGGEGDGHATVEHPFPAGPRAKARVFLRAARAADAQGRPRDAEVALLAACREQAAASTRPSLPLARVLTQLSERYVAAAMAQPPGAAREPFLARARSMLALGAEHYDRALGPYAPASHAAHERLAALDPQVLAAAEFAADGPAPQEPPPPQDQVTLAARPSPAPAVSTAPVRKAQAPVVAQVVETTARPGAPRATPVAARPAMPAPAPVAPAPDPQPPRLVAAAASDPDLRQLASDVARLRSQAEAVSDDPAGFERRAQAARAQRDQCRDAACLRDWYTARRHQLLAEF